LIFAAIAWLIASNLAMAAESHVPRNMAGYASELTLRPGDTVDFKVSVVGGGRYETDLVRVINGDSWSRYSDCFEVREVPAEFTGKYKGIEQDLNHGSYVHFENTGPLDDLESFTVAA
jgi:hypothetical protein